MQNLPIPTSLTLDLARKLIGRKVKLRFTEVITSDANEFMILHDEGNWLNVKYCYDCDVISARNYRIGILREGVFCNRRDRKPIMLTGLIE